MLRLSAARGIVTRPKKGADKARVFVNIVAQITTIVMLTPSPSVAFTLKIPYNARVNRGADQARRWDFYKLCAQAGGKRQIPQVSLTANFISRVKAAFTVPSFAPAYA